MGDTHRGSLLSWSFRVTVCSSTKVGMKQPSVVLETASDENETPAVELGRAELASLVAQMQALNQSSM